MSSRLLVKWFLPFLVLLLFSFPQDLLAAPSTGEIFVASSPSSGGVSLDGTYMGKTPILLEGLAPGAHLLRVGKSGYESHEELVQVFQGLTTPVTFTLSEDEWDGLSSAFAASPSSPRRVVITQDMLPKKAKPRVPGSPANEAPDDSSTVATAPKDETSSATSSPPSPDRLRKEEKKKRPLTADEIVKETTQKLRSHHFLFYEVQTTTGDQVALEKIFYTSPRHWRREWYPQWNKGWKEVRIVKGNRLLVSTPAFLSEEAAKGTPASAEEYFGLSRRGTPTMEKKEKVNGREAWILSFRKATGGITRVWLDTRTGVPLREEEYGEKGTLPEVVREAVNFSVNEPFPPSVFQL